MIQANESKQYSILIVEDEAAIAIDLQSILEDAAYEVCGIAYSYDQTMSILAEHKPDLALLDIALKGRENGLDIARVLAKKYQIPFVFLTSFSDSDTLKQAVNLNPAGYLVKPFREKDIIPAISVALANRVSFTSTDIPDLKYINGKIFKPLSIQEYKVLDLLCQGKSNKEIANELYVSTNTVKTHLYKLYQKMDTSTRSSTVSKVMKL